MVLEGDDARVGVGLALANRPRPRSRTRSVSPTNTGFGNFTSSQPRLATVVPNVVSYIDSPTMSPSVNTLFTSGLP